MDFTEGYMLLGFHRPTQFLYHHSKAKGLTNLFIDGVCYGVRKITSYAPTEMKDMPGLHLISRGFTQKIDINEKTQHAIIY